MHFHLTQQQRIELSLLLKLGHTQHNIALVLGVNPSTISRELGRNRRASGIYHPASARLRAGTRRANANALRTKLLANIQLAEAVERKLIRNDSPDQIAGWMRDTKRRVRVCAQTIYDWVYLHARHLLKHLHCRKGKYRLTRETALKKAFRDKLKEARRISARPAHIQRRSRYGHWEGDTVVGKGHSGCIATFVERKSGYLMAVKLARGTAKNFEVAAERSFAVITKSYRKTLTLDNGAEMSNYEEIELSTGLRIYFAQPYHSWERGTNENTNGLLRFYFPKQMRLESITQEMLDVAVKQLNTRPRKRLGYKTPEQVFKLKR
ncbi:MAG TPA: IS30 family transposase [Candidatus Saccharimonadales bacterium]|nr:IS30 family transposase [Candidatus Saccharimonadales bacterium]